MDTSDPEISFDSEGRCNLCTEFLKRRILHKYAGAESDAALDKLFADIKRAGRDNEYDCVIGVSGGGDSSYIALVAKQHGLRPLAVHMDNGWNSEEAVLNIKNITKRLGIDYESYVLDWSEFRDIQIAFLKASVPEAETPTDVAIAAALHHIADNHNIRYIVSGGNIETEGILPKSWHYNAKDLTYFNHIQNTFGTKRIRKFPTFGYLREAYYKLAKGIKTVYPLNLMPYEKNTTLATLESEIGWKDYGGKHHESRYTSFIQSYYLFEKFGIDYRRATLSAQICGGGLSRNAALGVLDFAPYDPIAIGDAKPYIAKKLNLSDREFDHILKLPPRFYWDYPNSERKLGLIYNTYRKLSKREKLGNF